MHVADYLAVDYAPPRWFQIGPVAIASVRVGSLIGSQNRVDSEAVADCIEDRTWDRYPIAVEAHKCGLRIVDGHHRAVAALKAGVEWIRAEIWDEFEEED